VDVYCCVNVVVEEAQEKQVSYKMFLPESLRAKFKSICALKGTSMNEVLVQLVQKWIEENENISSPKKDKKG
jgi:ParG